MSKNYLFTTQYMPQDCFLNAFAKIEGSCPFLSATARRKKSKKSLSSDWAENLAESNKGLLLRPGLMTEGVERAAPGEQPSAECDPSVSTWPFTTSWRSGKQRHWNKRIGDLSFLSRKRWSCGEFTYLVPFGCSSGRTKPVRRTKLILHFRRRKAGR